MSKKFDIWTSVNNGLLTDNKDQLTRAIRHFEGQPIIITIQKNSPKRSNDQNRYYWGVVVKLVVDGLRETQGQIFSAKEAHEFLKANFNFKEMINLDTGEVYNVPQSTTADNTQEFMDYLQRVKQFAFNFLGIDIPDPQTEE